MWFPVQQEIYTILFCCKDTYRTISWVATSNARFWDLDPHDIEASDVHGSISKEWTSLWKWSSTFRTVFCLSSKQWLQNFQLKVETTIKPCNRCNNLFHTAWNSLSDQKGSWEAQGLQMICMATASSWCPSKETWPETVLLTWWIQWVNMFNMK